jgi:hypothetical protein
MKGVKLQGAVHFFAQRQEVVNYKENRRRGTRA